MSLFIHHSQLAIHHSPFTIRLPFRPLALSPLCHKNSDRQHPNYGGYDNLFHLKARARAGIGEHLSVAPKRRLHVYRACLFWQAGNGGFECGENRKRGDYEHAEQTAGLVTTERQYLMTASEATE